MAEEQKESTSILEKVKGAASAATEKVSDIKAGLWDEEKAAIVAEFKDQGVEKVKTMFENINNSVVIFDHSGFSLISLGVMLGIPPDVSASFILNRKISEQERKNVLNEAVSNRLLTIVLKCLFKASDFYDKIHLSGYKLSTIDIVLGLTPGIELRFIKDSK